MSNEVLTIKQVAERWHVDRDTIYRMISSGKLKAFQVGRQWRVTAETVAEYEGRGLAV